MSWKTDRARLAGLGNAKVPDPLKLADARRDYAASRLEDYVNRTVQAAPPLTPEQRDRIAAALWSGKSETTGVAA